MTEEGSDLDSSCLGCGAHVPWTASFCGRCGTASDREPVDEEDAVTEPLSAEAQAQYAASIAAWTNPELLFDPSVEWPDFPNLAGRLRYCRNCGRGLSTDDLYCVGCGLRRHQPPKGAD